MCADLPTQSNYDKVLVLLSAREMGLDVVSIISHPCNNILTKQIGNSGNPLRNPAYQNIPLMVDPTSPHIDSNEYLGLFQSINSLQSISTVCRPLRN